MGFCRFHYRANLQKLEMTPIWQVNVAPSAGDWSKQLYLQAGAGSCRHQLQGGLQHLLDGLPLRNPACQEPELGSFCAWSLRPARPPKYIPAETIIRENSISGEPITWAEFYEALAKAAGVYKHIRRINRPRTGERAIEPLATLTRR